MGNYSSYHIVYRVDNCHLGFRDKMEIYSSQKTRSRSFTWSFAKSCHDDFSKSYQKTNPKDSCSLDKGTCHGDPNITCCTGPAHKPSTEWPSGPYPSLNPLKGQYPKCPSISEKKKGGNEDQLCPEQDPNKLTCDQQYVGSYCDLLGTPDRDTPALVGICSGASKNAGQICCGNKIDINPMPKCSDIAIDKKAAARAAGYCAQQTTANPAGATTTSNAYCNTSGPGKGTCHGGDTPVQCCTTD